MSCLGSRLAPVMLSGAYLQRAGVFSLQQPMPPGIKPPQHCASPEPFRLAADSTTVF
ncbi:integrase, partial [Shigella flexneri]|nr:integrase [Shigella flexneri]